MGYTALALRSAVAVVGVAHVDPPPDGTCTRGRLCKYVLTSLVYSEHWTPDRASACVQSQAPGARNPDYHAAQLNERTISGYLHYHPGQWLCAHYCRGGLRSG